jgi:hypothetical protein
MFRVEDLQALTPLRSTTPDPAHPNFGHHFQDSLAKLAHSTSHAVDMVAHAQQLRLSLDVAGMVSCPASPRQTSQIQSTNIQPFMGHVSDRTSVQEEMYS